MKNKIVVLSISIGLIVYFFLNFLKWFPAINSEYNSLFLSIQLNTFTTALTVIVFSVFGYGLLTYAIAFVMYIGFYSNVIRFLEAYYTKVIPVIGFERVIMYSTCLVLTFLTFYILKKCKVNLNLPVNKKQA